MHQQKTRSEMDKRWMWNLNDILDGSPAFDKMFAEAEAAVSAVVRTTAARIAISLFPRMTNTLTDLLPQ